MSMILMAANAVSSLSHVGSLAMLQADKIDSGNAKTLEVFVAIAAIALLSQAAVIVGIGVLVFKLRKEVLSHIEEIKGKAMPLMSKSQELVENLSPQVRDITGKVQTLVTDLSPKITSITGKVDTLVGDLTPKINSITAKVDTLVGELTPKITGITEQVHTITGHVEAMTGVARDKVHEFASTLSQANETARDGIAMTRETLVRTNDTVRATVEDVNGKTRKQIDRFNGIVSDALDATVKLGKAIEHGVTAPAREVAGLASGAKATFDHLLKQYGGLFRFGSKSKAAQRPPANVPPVAPHRPEGMGTQPFGSAVNAAKHEYMDERDLGL